MDRIEWNGINFVVNFFNNKSEEFRLPYHTTGRIFLVQDIKLILYRITTKMNAD